MKIKLTVLLILLFFSAQGQNLMDIYNDTSYFRGRDYQTSMYYSEAAFCSPGEAIQEEITFYSNMTFLYLSFKIRGVKIVASGKYSQKNKHLNLNYTWVKLDTNALNKDSIDVNKINLYTEFRIVKDRHWADADILRLLECGSHMSKFRCFLVYGKNWNHHRNIFLVKRKRLVLKRFTTYGLFKEQANQ